MLRSKPSVVTTGLPVLAAEQVGPVPSFGATCRDFLLI